MRLALAQINPTVGDLSANARVIEAYSRKAAEQGADVVCFPELALTGYPPRDLLGREGFIEDAAEALRGVAAATRDMRDLWIVIGCPWKPPARDGSSPPEAFDSRARPTNALVVVRGGGIAARCDKRLLPTYDVFDEDRYFEPGSHAEVIEVRGVKVGLSICEDLWRAVDVGEDVAGVGGARYADQPDPMEALIRAGARVVLNPSASPFVLGKGARQRDIIEGHVARHGVTIAAVNQVGGNDDLIFDGHSVVIAPGPAGAPVVVAAGCGFAEDLVVVDVPVREVSPIADPVADAEEMDLLFHALVLGIRDYARKSGFKEAVVAVSGGIDSAVVVALGAAALGPERITGIAMPSRHSSDHSVTDAQRSCAAIGCRYVEVPIEPAHAAMEGMLGSVWREIGADAAAGITEENLQSRLRGTIVMAHSNKTGALLLTTGNKSELAVGYCTLYGDMNGGLAVISDCTKGRVYRLARWMNAHWREAGFAGPPVPEGSIAKPPSAELRPGQLDQDTLPEYEVLDAIVERYVEHHQSVARIARETGFDAALVARIARMIDLAEYKRKQMPIGLKVTTIAFGRGRRMPVVQGYRSR